MVITFVFIDGHLLLCLLDCMLKAYLQGVGPPGFSLTLFQSLATAAGYDPVKGPGSSCLAPNSSGRCVLLWAGGTKAVSSVVLIANSVSFAIMAVFFTTIGSAADYGNFGRWLQLAITCICWGAQFASMSLTGV